MGDSGRGPKVRGGAGRSEVVTPTDWLQRCSSLLLLWLENGAESRGLGIWVLGGEEPGLWVHREPRDRQLDAWVPESSGHRSALGRSGRE